MTEQTDTPDSESVADPQTSGNDSPEAAASSSTGEADQAATPETQATDSEPAPEAIQAAEPAAPEAVPDLPAPRTNPLPTVGRIIYVYGIEHDGRAVAAMVADVDLVKETVTVSGARRNGQHFAHSHVYFLAGTETREPKGVYADWMDYQKRQGSDAPNPSVSQQQNS